MPRAMAHCLYSIDAGLLDSADAEDEIAQTCAALQTSLTPEQKAQAAELAQALQGRSHIVGAIGRVLPLPFHGIPF